MKEDNLTIFSHPLIKHKISLLREQRTETKDFRRLVEEIALLEGYEALADLATEMVTVQTPIESCSTPMLSGKEVAFIPILRAGLGMLPGLLTLVPTAKVGHVGMKRDEHTHSPIFYYCKLPSELHKRVVIVIDPMLATGGTAVETVKLLKKEGAKKIKFLCIIAAPEGVSRLQEAHPDIEIYVGQLDCGLTSEAYIHPGLGDAGDRIFGTD